MLNCHFNFKIGKIGNLIENLKKERETKVAINDFFKKQIEERTKELSPQIKKKLNPLIDDLLMREADQKAIDMRKKIDKLSKKGADKLFDKNETIKKTKKRGGFYDQRRS